MTVGGTGVAVGVTVWVGGGVTVEVGGTGSVGVGGGGVPVGGTGVAVAVAVGGTGVGVAVGEGAVVGLAVAVGGDRVGGGGSVGVAVGGMEVDVAVAGRAQISEKEISGGVAPWPPGLLSPHTQPCTSPCRTRVSDAPRFEKAQSPSCGNQYVQKVQGDPWQRQKQDSAG